LWSGISRESESKVIYQESRHKRSLFAQRYDKKLIHKRIDIDLLYDEEIPNKQTNQR